MRAASAQIIRVNDEARDRGSVLPSVEQLVRVAHEALDAANCPVGPAKINKLVRRYVREVAPYGVEFGSWLAANVGATAERRATISAAAYKHISYRDDTGEEAAHNVDKARRQAVTA